MNREPADPFETAGPPEPEEWPPGRFLLGGLGDLIVGSGADAQVGPERVRGPLGWHELAGLTSSNDEE